MKPSWSSFRDRLSVVVAQPLIRRAPLPGARTGGKSPAVLGLQRRFGNIAAYRAGAIDAPEKSL